MATENTNSTTNQLVKSGCYSNCDYSIYIIKCKLIYPLSYLYMVWNTSINPLLVYLSDTVPANKE